MSPEQVDQTKKERKLRKKLEKRQRKLEKKLQALEKKLRELEQRRRAAPKAGGKPTKQVVAKSKKKTRALAPRKKTAPVSAAAPALARKPAVGESGARERDTGGAAQQPGPAAAHGATT